jgi:hypothetical protein
VRDKMALEIKTTSGKKEYSGLEKQNPLGSKCRTDVSDTADGEELLAFLSRRCLLGNNGQKVALLG